ncbi:unnamed protein product [Lactuca virosa]|uniref:Uncharacterized protein n=1 Tax=Lactuca virosa TaxID=75947 RepID=A0AAU9PNW3_9ASTR|nr:unnamed protein product [Lactuca virosa]
MNFLFVDFYAHSKPEGTSFPQWLSNKLMEADALRLTPNRLALMALQMHAAASSSTRPKKRSQQGEGDGVPAMMPCTKSLRTLAHIPNLRPFIAQVASGNGSELTKVKKIRLRVTRKAVVLKALEAILMKNIGM